MNDEEKRNIPRITVREDKDYRYVSQRDLRYKSGYRPEEKFPKWKLIRQYDGYLDHARHVGNHLVQSEPDEKVHVPLISPKKKTNG